MKINEGKIFYFPKLSEKNYYIIIFVLCSLFRRALPYLIESTDFGKIKIENFNKSCLFDMLSNFIGDFLTGTYKIYLLFTNHKDKNKEYIRNDNILNEKENFEAINSDIIKINEINLTKILQKKI